MRAVAFTRSLPISEPDALVDIELDRPKPGPRDLLVKVEAVSVNPVDVKMRAGGDPADGPRVLGFDAAGTVAAVGAEATLFKPGDAVWYAGSRLLPGTDSEYHLVDESIVGRKPTTLDFAQAAALPLTGLTAWELLFDRIGVAIDTGGDRETLLVIGGAGGVGSIAIQLARTLTKLTVIATASRPSTENWVRKMGAHHVVDHSAPLAPQLAALGIPLVDVVTAFVATRSHAAEIADIIAPEGRIGLIEGAAGFGAPELDKLFRKSAALCFELMFTRAMFQTKRMAEQHRILNEQADLVDEGQIRTTLTETLSPINAANLIKAHALVETGRSIGKVVVAGWPPR